MSQDDPPFVPLWPEFPCLFEGAAARIVCSSAYQGKFLLGNPTATAIREVLHLVVFLHGRIDVLKGCNCFTELRLGSRKTEALTVALELRLIRILMCGADIPDSPGKLLLDLVQDCICVLEHRCRSLQKVVDMDAVAGVHDDVRLRKCDSLPRRI